jgi:sec-independent protein translocase protein TatB
MEFISNFNGLELIFIIILAILLFGPEKIPEYAAKLGTWVRSLRDFSSQFIDGLSEEAGLDELSDEGSSLTDSIKQTSADLNQAVQTIRSPVDSINRTLQNQNASSQSKQNPEKALPNTPDDTDKSKLHQRLISLEQELQEIRSALADAQEENPGKDIND